MLTLLLVTLFSFSPIQAQSLPFEQSGAVDLGGVPIHSSPQNATYTMVGSTPEYVLGPGDQLKIVVNDGTDIEETLVRILPDSTISLPVLALVSVAGSTVSEVTKQILDELALYFRTPSVQVVIEKHVSKSAAVFGALNPRTATIGAQSSGPGTYALTGRTTALGLIFMAGGPSPDARLDQVTLTRGARSYSLDLLRATRSGDNSHNIPLEHGDILQVSGTQQADSRIAILGEVRNPGVKNLSSQANMLEAIAEVTGFTEDASANRIRVIRRTDPTNPTILTVNAERIMKGDLSQNVRLHDGDIVVVPRDWLTNLGDLLDQLQPIISWNGLITTEPIMSVGGYTINDESTTITTPEEAAAATSALQDFTAQQAIINQVQQNLRTPRK
tara:strand:- start:291 stop:1451 length:1161 start_codon:yes stop_codon:yes gene_type:complete